MKRASLNNEDGIKSDNGRCGPGFGAGITHHPHAVVLFPKDESMSTKSALFVVALGTLALTGCKRPTEFTSTEYKFKATFPGSPKVDEQTALGVKFKMFSTDSRNGGVAVGVADMPIPPNEAEAEIQKRLDGARDGAIQNVGGKQRSSDRITLDGKYPGREFSADLTKPANAQLRARIYLVGTRLYQVLVVGTSNYVNSAEANTFLNSFKLLP
jgi:hypothetical protein